MAFVSIRLDTASSSNVKVMLFTSVPPPVSDISNVFAPVGPTSRMSMSSGNEWLSPVRVTVTLATVPETPDIVIVDGYGDAEPLVPLAGMAIAVVFEFETGVETGTPSVNVLVIVPRLVAPSWSCSTAPRLAPHVPVAVNVNDWAPVAPPAVTNP